MIDLVEACGTGGSAADPSIEKSGVCPAGPLLGGRGPDHDMDNDAQKDGNVSDYAPARTNKPIDRVLVYSGPNFPGRYASGDHLLFVDGHVKRLYDWKDGETTFEPDSKNYE